MMFGYGKVKVKLNGRTYEGIANGDVIKMGDDFPQSPLPYLKTPKEWLNRKEKHMNKVVIELDEKWKPYVDVIHGLPYVRNIISVDINATIFGKPIDQELEDLTREWFGEKSDTNTIKAIERIHSADEIKYIEAKYKWVLKDEYRSDKYFNKYFNVEDKGMGDRWNFTGFSNSDDLSQSGFKQALIDTHCPIPFECWEIADES